jgi:hypothetical protein
MCNGPWIQDCTTEKMCYNVDEKLSTYVRLASITKTTLLDKERHLDSLLNHLSLSHRPPRAAFEGAQLIERVLEQTVVSLERGRGSWRVQSLETGYTADTGRAPAGRAARSFAP